MSDLYRYPRKTNYYETDQMSIIHHSNYIRYFEEARLGWMEEIGMDYATVEKMGLIIPVMFVNCEYLVPLRYGDEIEIITKLRFFDGIKMEFGYEVYRRGDTTPCTTGSSGHCFLDREMKPVRLKREYPDIYELMLQALQRDGGTRKRNRKE